MLKEGKKPCGSNQRRQRASAPINKRVLYAEETRRQTEVTNSFCNKNIIVS
jgi:hypothetical protein